MVRRDAQGFFIQTLLTCFSFCITGPAHQSAILAVVLSGCRLLSSYYPAAWMDVSPSLSVAHIHAQPRMCTKDHSSKNTPANHPSTLYVVPTGKSCTGAGTGLRPCLGLYSGIGNAQGLGVARGTGRGRG
ncbi:hypothetical protein M405DRAFT_585095 [Rhizopogon salebrosus TDB-379]|nr:hypothetical protein M405DRAFT_585095 [Rhizopogon salebrosus TDB-379]